MTSVCEQQCLVWRHSRTVAGACSSTEMCCLPPALQEEAAYKLLKVVRQQVGKGGIPYIATHDGRTIRYPDPDIKARPVPSSPSQDPPCWQPGPGRRGSAACTERCAVPPAWLLPGLVRGSSRTVVLACLGKKSAGVQEYEHMQGWAGRA